MRNFVLKKLRNLQKVVKGGSLHKVVATLVLGGEMD
jgi:hypothetical protein